MSANPDERSSTEELKVKGDALVGKVKELVHEGNVRRIIIKDADGKTVIEVPLTLGIFGAAVAPTVAAVGAVAAIAADYSIVVERQEDDGGAPQAGADESHEGRGRSRSLKLATRS
jgi:Domain of unknown function (DUF4342)